MQCRRHTENIWGDGTSQGSKPLMSKDIFRKALRTIFQLGTLLGMLFIEFGLRPCTPKRSLRNVESPP
jgi:hypothetical protein